MPPAVRSVLACSLLGLWGTQLAHAQAQPLPDLGAEWQPVVEEVHRMLKTDINAMPHFEVRAATPERVAELAGTPGFLTMRAAMRANALAFAGWGNTLLTFDKPSDVIAKVERWFPVEVEATRKSTSSMKFYSEFTLFGPFANWTPEAMAFQSLWNCMPKSAWVSPHQNPFLRRSGDGLPLLPISARSSDIEQYDFGRCVRERNGYEFPNTTEDRARRAADKKLIAQTVTPVLADKFARFLRQHRCALTGPDDCVLVLRLWSELAPADPALVAAIRELEADVAPDAPLPVLHNPEASWPDAQESDGQARFDAALRRAAYLKLKLWSIVHARPHWRDKDVAATLRQLTTLMTAYRATYPQRYRWYVLGYYNSPIDPWMVLIDRADAAAKLAPDAEREIARLGPEGDCRDVKQWFLTQEMEARHMLRWLRNSLHPGGSPHPLRCGIPDMAWLRQQAQTEHRGLLYSYLALMPYLREADRARLKDAMIGPGAPRPTEGG